MKKSSIRFLFLLFIDCRFFFKKCKHIIKDFRKEKFIWSEIFQLHYLIINNEQNNKYMTLKTENNQ